MDTSLCGDAPHLLDSYVAALSAFHDAQEPFLDGLQPGDPEWEKFATDKERAFARLAAARREYYKHVEWHGCRKTGDLTAYLVEQVAVSS